MQTPYGAPYGGPPPPPPHIPAKDVRPRRIWYAIAALLGLVLAGAGAVFIGVMVKDTVNSVDTAHSFSGGGSQTFSFVRGETKAIYVSQYGKGRVDCRIPQMPSSAITHPGSSFQVTLGSRTWERVFEVQPSSSGDYALTCTSELPAEFALGNKPHLGKAIGSIAAGIGCFFAAFAAAVTITVVTAVRRHHHRRRLAATSPPQWGPPPQWSAPPQWGPPPSGPGPGYPPGSRP